MGGELGCSPVPHVRSNGEDSASVRRPEASSGAAAQTKRWHNQVDLPRLAVEYARRSGEQWGCGAAEKMAYVGGLYRADHLFGAESASEGDKDERRAAGLQRDRRDGSKVDWMASLLSRCEASAPALTAAQKR